jgi:hypothetical protein
MIGIRSITYAPHPATMTIKDTTLA